MSNSDNGANGSSNPALELIRTWLLSKLPSLPPSDLDAYSMALLNDGYSTSDELEGLNSGASGRMEDLYFMGKKHRRMLTRELKGVRNNGSRIVTPTGIASTEVDGEFALVEEFLEQGAAGNTSKTVENDAKNCENSNDDNNFNVDDTVDHNFNDNDKNAVAGSKETDNSAAFVESIESVFQVETHSESVGNVDARGTWKNTAVGTLDASESRVLPKWSLGKDERASRKHLLQKLTHNADHSGRARPVLSFRAAAEPRERASDHRGPGDVRSAMSEQHVGTDSTAREVLSRGDIRQSSDQQTPDSTVVREVLSRGSGDVRAKKRTSREGKEAHGVVAKNNPLSEEVKVLSRSTTTTQPVSSASTSHQTTAFKMKVPSDHRGPGDGNSLTKRATTTQTASVASLSGDERCARPSAPSRRSVTNAAAMVRIENPVRTQSTTLSKSNPMVSTLTGGGSAVGPGEGRSRPERKLRTAQPGSLSRSETRTRPTPPGGRSDGYVAVIDRTGDARQGRRQRVRKSPGKSPDKCERDRKASSMLARLCFDAGKA